MNESMRKFSKFWDQISLLLCKFNIMALYKPNISINMDKRNLYNRYLRIDNII